MYKGELDRNFLIKERKGPQDNCAVVGVFSSSHDVSQLAFNGLVELNHRGQESSGIVVSNGREFKIVKDIGLASIVFELKHSLPNLPDAHVAIGQDRYSTSGGLADVQPFLDKDIAIAHNGNLTNIKHLREKYNLPAEIDGAKSDTRVALAVINKMPGNVEEKILSGVKEFEGAFNFVFATKDKLYATRDVHGFRPFSIGKINGDGFVVASETAAFPNMGAEFLRDVMPGETIRIDKDGIKTIGLDKKSRLSQCIFELIYLARPDSTVFGISVVEFRMQEGRNLAKHMPGVDLVMPVPRSGICAGLGVADSDIAKEKDIPYVETLYTNPYRAVVRGPRTFIQPNGRDRAATEKYSANKSVLEGKRVAVVDDSIVRGSLQFVVEKLRKAGVKEVHALIASPPIKYPCPYGVDTHNGELLANEIPDIKKRAEYLGLDSLYHLSYAELLGAAEVEISEISDEKLFEENNFCGACFTGKYPTSIEGVIAKSVCLTK